MTMSRARTALAALAALAASASAALAPTALAASPSAAVAVPAATNCSRERHIRIGIFDEANPFAVALLTGWMDEKACWCPTPVVGPRGQHRGAFFRASVANLDA